MLSLSNSSFQTATAASHGISQSSVSRCIAAVSDSLYMHAKEFITFPNQEEQLEIQQSFLEKEWIFFSTSMH